MTKHRIAPVHLGVYLKELFGELKISQYRIFYSFNSGDDKKRHGHYKHGYAYNLSYGEKIKE